MKCKDDNFKKAMRYNIFGMRLWGLKDRSGSEPELWHSLSVWAVSYLTSLRFGGKRETI